MDITGSFPVGAPLLGYMHVESDEYTYGNIDVSPAWVECDAGGATDTYAGKGLRLEEVARKSSNDRVRRSWDQSAFRRNELRDRATGRRGNRRVVVSGENPIIRGDSVNPVVHR
jgi:hypothetical protein